MHTHNHLIGDEVNELLNFLHRVPLDQGASLAGLDLRERRELEDLLVLVELKGH